MACGVRFFILAGSSNACRYLTFCRYDNALKKANIATMALQQQQTAEEDVDEGDEDLQVCSSTYLRPLNSCPISRILVLGSALKENMHGL